MSALRHILSARDVTSPIRDTSSPHYPRALPEESRAMVKAKMEAMGYPVVPPAVPEKEHADRHGDPQNLQPLTYNNNDANSRPHVQSVEYDRSDYTSIYEERMSQDISSALSNHLAYRPLNPQHQSESKPSKGQYQQRRRSRSAEGNREWNWNKEQTQRQPRGDSLRSSSQPPDQYKEASNLIQTMQDRQKSPQPKTVS